MTNTLQHNKTNCQDSTCSQRANSGCVRSCWVLGIKQSFSAVFFQVRTVFRARSMLAHCRCSSHSRVGGFCHVTYECVALTEISDDYSRLCPFRAAWRRLHSEEATNGYWLFVLRKLLWRAEFIKLHWQVYSIIQASLEKKCPVVWKQ